MAGTDPSQKEILGQLGALIEEGLYFSKSYHRLGPTSPYITEEPEERLRAFVTLAIVVIDRIAGVGSQFHQNIPLSHGPSPLMDSNGRWIISTTSGVLIALHTAVNQGLLVSLESTLRASIHDDFLVQASELLDSQYYVPALMLTSAVLENHLNRMTQARGLSVSGKGTLAKYNDLLRDNPYNQSVWRRIQSIGDLRNEADHGDFSTVNSHNAQDTHAFVQRFIADHPA